MARTRKTQEIENQIALALEPFGFARVKAGNQMKLVRKINPDVEIYFYPGVERRKGHFTVEPVIGLDFLPLKRKLEQTESNPTTQICHALLGLIDQNNAWITLELEGEDIQKDALEIIIGTIEHTALPRLLELSSVDKIRELLEDAVHRRYRPGFVVLQEHLKLSVLDRLLAEQSFGRLH